VLPKVCCPICCMKILIIFRTKHCFRRVIKSILPVSIPVLSQNFKHCQSAHQNDTFHTPCRPLVHVVGNGLGVSLSSTFIRLEFQIARFGQSIQLNKWRSQIRLVMNGISSHEYKFSHLRFIAPFTCPLPSPSYYSFHISPCDRIAAFITHWSSSLLFLQSHLVNPVFVSQAPKSWIWLSSPSHSQTPLQLHRKPCTSPIFHPRFSPAYFPSTSVCRCQASSKLSHHYYTDFSVQIDTLPPSPTQKIEVTPTCPAVLSFLSLYFPLTNIIRYQFWF